MKIIQYNELSFTVEEISDNEYKLIGVMEGDRSLPGIPFQRRMDIASSAEIDRSFGLPEEVSEGDVGSVVGVASSTSVDSYGTEMSLAGLESMAAQFNSGVPLTPRHNGDQGAVEWDEVIGETYRGDIERVGAVVEAADPSEEAYILRVWSRLYAGVDKASALARRLESKQPIGMSIGGWFVDSRIVTDADDEVERVIIDGVVLDHLAITRRPANPDSVGLDLARSLGEAVVKCRRSFNEGIELTENATKLERTMEQNEEVQHVEEDAVETVELSDSEELEVEVEETEAVETEEADEVEVEELAEEVEEVVELAEEPEEAPEADEADEVDSDETPEEDPAEEPAEEPVEEEVVVEEEEVAPEEGRSVDALLETILELRTAVQDLNSRFDALTKVEEPVVEAEEVTEERGADTPDPASQIEALKAKVEELESEPQPKAVAPEARAEEVAKSPLAELIERAGAEHKHIGDALKRHETILSAPVKAGAIKRSSDLGDALRDLFSAGVEDGLIEKPFAR